MKKELNQFYIMHKNKETGLVSLDKETGYIISINILDKKEAPIGINNNKAFVNWWERRAIPKTQDNKDILLNDMTNTEYMMKNLGLSLNDCYWIKPIESNYTWEQVNFFENNFYEIDMEQIKGKTFTPFKPSATTQGELQKRWCVINNDRFLLKGNYGNMYRQSINEVFATLLHKKQNVEHTSYSLINLPTTMGEGIGCISKNFSNKDIEFIPAYDITFIDKKPNEKSEYQHYIDTCIKYGINRNIMQKHMDYMIMSDFLLTNTDRHLLNFGILRDVNTLKFIKPAPIFDTGNSMFHNFNYNETKIYDVKITSFYKTETKMLEQVKNRDVLDLSKVPTIDELKELYSKDPYSVVYLDNLIDGYCKKIEMLNAFQKGYSLNPRSDKFYKKFNIENPFNLNEQKETEENFER